MNCDGLLKLSKKMQLLETQPQDESTFTQKAKEMLKYALCKEYSKTDIILHTCNTGPRFLVLCDDNFKCPHCNRKFEDIANLRKHFKTQNVQCHVRKVLERKSKL